MRKKKTGKKEKKRKKVLNYIHRRSGLDLIAFSLTLATLLIGHTQHIVLFVLYLLELGD